MKVDGKLFYLWRAVDHEGEVLETVVTAKRDKRGAEVSQAHHEEIWPTSRRRHRWPLLVFAAMKEISNADRQEVGGRLNNRAENSNQPFRRRERAMQRFRSMKTLQKFSSVQAEVHNHSIRSAISSLAKLTNKDEPARWPNGAPSRPPGSSSRRERIPTAPLRSRLFSTPAGESRASSRATRFLSFTVRRRPRDLTATASATAWSGRSWRLARPPCGKVRAFCSSAFSTMVFDVLAKRPHRLASAGRHRS